jgi:predicted TPR repeat methyltransferase
MMAHREEVLVKPYSKLAEIYDDVMSHVDYKKWANYLHQIINEWQPHCRSLLDIGAGTGSFLINLKLKNADLFGFDNCFEMISIAKKKKSHTANISFFQSDMISFHLKKKFDVVVCLYDSINYLLNFDLWQQAFIRVKNTLNGKGIFVFDVCTEKNSVKYFDNYSERNSGHNYEYTRNSSYDRKERIHKNEFIISFQHESAKYIERHKQKIFLIEEILQFINSTKFKLLGCFDGYSFKAGSEDSLRVHFILQTG